MRKKKEIKIKRNETKLRATLIDCIGSQAPTVSRLCLIARSESLSSNDLLESSKRKRKEITEYTKWKTSFCGKQRDFKLLKVYYNVTDFLAMQSNLRYTILKVYFKIIFFANLFFLFFYFSSCLCRGMPFSVDSSNFLKLFFHLFMVIDILFICDVCLPRVSNLISKVHFI